MKLGRFSSNGRIFYGQILTDMVRDLSTQREFSIGELIPWPPVAPSKIIAAGLNYHQHQEQGHTLPSSPLIFLKPPSSLIGNGADIPYPALSQDVYFEGELGVVIGQRTRHIKPQQAKDHILGYCCANDVTAWDILQRENNYGVAKSFDGFTPVGPWVETEIDPSNLRIETRLNGQLRQSANTSDMVFSVTELIAYISQVMTLELGDLVLTGTPVGMGPIVVGDHVEVTIEGIGSLCNGVARFDDMCNSTSTIQHTATRVALKAGAT